MNDILKAINETLSYFDDEFSDTEQDHVWDEPISQYAGGITPRQLREIEILLRRNRND